MVMALLRASNWARMDFSAKKWARRIGLGELAAPSIEEKWTYEYRLNTWEGRKEKFESADCIVDSWRTKISKTAS